MMRCRFVILVAVVMLLLCGPEARGAQERLVTIEGHPPIHSLEIGELIDVKGKGKKFTGAGMLILTDGRRFALNVKQKRNAKKLKSTFVLKSPKKTTPKIKVTLKTTGEPEQLRMLKFSFKDVDRTRTKFKEKAGASGIAVRPVDAVLSAKLTLRGVRALIDGEDTFDDTTKLLDDALAADFRNKQPLFFRALAQLFATTRATLVAPGGNLRSLYTRAGILPPVGSWFWDLRWGAEEHGQGQIKDGAPTGDEIIASWRSDVALALRTFLKDIEDVPADFEYRISAVDAMDDPFDGDPSDDLETVWVDAGDVEFLRSVAEALLVIADIVDAYDWDDVDPNDFDPADHIGLDAIARVESVYPAAGTLARPAKLTSARRHLARAREAYDRGAAHVLAESAEESDNGLFTPFRDTFRGTRRFESTEERDAFVGGEDTFRTWFGDLVDSFEFDVPYTIATEPDGTPIEIGRRDSLNVFQLLDESTGVEFRTLFFKVVTDPLTNRRVLGVSSFEEITTAMRTADGVVNRVRGVAPSRGDLMSGHTSLYALRIDAPPEHDKTVDGDLGDWSFGTNSVQIFEGPRAQYDPPRGTWGNVYLALGTNDLFLAFAGDPRKLQTFAIKIKSPGGSASAGMFAGVFSGTPRPTVSVGASGAEFAFPLANFGTSSWVKIRLSARNDAGEHVNAGPFYVRID